MGNRDRSRSSSRSVLGQISVAPTGNKLIAGWSTIVGALPSLAVPAHMARSTGLLRGEGGGRGRGQTSPSRASGPPGASSAGRDAQTMASEAGLGAGMLGWHHRALRWLIGGDDRPGSAIRFNRSTRVVARCRAQTFGARHAGFHLRKTGQAADSKAYNQQHAVRGVGHPLLDRSGLGEAVFTGEHLCSQRSSVGRQIQIGRVPHVGGPGATRGGRRAPGRGGTRAGIPGLLGGGEYANVIIGGCGRGNSVGAFFFSTRLGPGSASSPRG